MIETGTSKTKYKKSFIEMILEDDNFFNKPYVKKVIEYGVKEEGRPLIHAKYKSYCLYSGTVSGFKPVIARNLYKRYKPTLILDPCAGWGGRALGAMSLNINYVGFDTNINLKPAYEKMKSLYPSDSLVDIYFKDSSRADFSQFSYDMVFTSPPYYVRSLLEIYENMPYYENELDFNNSFLRPMVSNSWKHLKPNGVMALNVPLNAYKFIETILGECADKIPLYLSKRKGGENIYKEFIYIWIKP
jgi:hypothetical protein